MTWPTPASILSVICCSRWRTLTHRTKATRSPQHRAKTGYPRRLLERTHVDNIMTSRGLQSDQWGKKESVLKFLEVYSASSLPVVILLCKRTEDYLFTYNCSCTYWWNHFKSMQPSLSSFWNNLCSISMSVFSNPEFEWGHTMLINLHLRFHLIMSWSSLFIVPSNKVLYFVITEMYSLSIYHLLFYSDL